MSLGIAAPTAVHRLSRSHLRRLVTVLAAALLGVAALAVTPGTAHADSGCGGPFYTYGDIEKKWLEVTYYRGNPLGCPVNFESNASDRAPGSPMTGPGRWQEFQHGWIFWASWLPSSSTHYGDTRAYAVYGNIAAKWLTLGRENGTGYPTTDTTTTPDGIGQYNHFQNGLSIYWSPSTGAHQIYGAIRDKWAGLGWERSRLGYPTSDETDGAGFTGRVSYFQHGELRWMPNDPVNWLIAITRTGNRTYNLVWWARAGWDHYNIRYGDPDQYVHCWQDYYGTFNGGPHVRCDYPNGEDEHQYEVGSGTSSSTDINIGYAHQNVYFKIQGCNDGGFLASSNCSSWSEYRIPA